MFSIFRYSFLVMILYIFCNNFCYAIINIHHETTIRESTDLHIAKNIADNISNSRHRPNLDLAIRNAIMPDHSQSHHRANASYFRTDDEDAIRELIKLTIRDADSFDMYSRAGKYRLTIRKTISQGESSRILGKKHIGYDGDEGKGTGEYRTHIIACFDITDIESLEDSLSKGAFLTAFPGRPEQICN